MEVYDWLADIALTPFDQYPVFEVSFKNGARKGFFRNDHHLDICNGDNVVVESAIGYDIGQVTLGGELVKVQMKKRRVKENEELPRILRIASEQELELMKQARAREKETMLQARVIARNLGLDMKLGDVEYQADNKKATFYYTANHRVDFRELIKVLAKEFKVKIEMRQIGARQEAGRVGGIGSCGRELCCSTWLTNFKTVNTSAARYQNLSINQTKLSGQCGRLKCCLNYELDTYLDALKDIPQKADILETEAGPARLVKTDILKGIMYYQYQGAGTFYPIPIDKVKTILEMNAKKQKPADLLEMADVQENAETIEFVDVVGQVTLKSLEKTERRSKNKKKNKAKGQGQAANQQANKPNPQPQPQGSNLGNPPERKEGQDGQRRNKKKKRSGPGQNPGGQSGNGP
jgi:cell fate regulator YaaT (PSP1 superfamily)